MRDTDETRNSVRRLIVHMATGERRWRHAQLQRNTNRKSYITSISIDALHSEIKRLLKVTDNNHVYCKSGNISAAVENNDVIRLLLLVMCELMTCRMA